MTFGDYIAVKIAIHFRGFIILGGFVFVLAGMTELCLSQVREKPAEVNKEERRPQGTIRITPGLRYTDVEGVGEVVQPLVEEIRTSNKQEAVENHKRWPECSPNPEDY